MTWTPGWVWLLPVTFLLASIAMVEHSGLREAGVLRAATLVLSTLLIAVSEELVFRGLVLTFLRDRAPEWVAAVAARAHRHRCRLGLGGLLRPHHGYRLD